MRALRTVVIRLTHLMVFLAHSRLFLLSATANRRAPSASGRSSSRGRGDAPVELQQIRDGLEDELRVLKRQYSEIASHLSQVSFRKQRIRGHLKTFDFFLASDWQRWVAAEQQPFV